MRARGTLAAAVALALLASRAQAQGAPRTVSTGVTTGQALRIGGLVGFDFTEGETGLGLRVDGELPIQTIGPRVDLGVLGSLGYTHFANSVTGIYGRTSQSTNILKLVPAARFTIPLAPKLGVYGDAGLGVYLARSSVETTSQFGRVDSTRTSTGVTMRLGAGGFYDVNERLRLGAELALNPYLGDYSDDTFSALASLMYRL